MAETKREIERKYESDESGLPDLTGVAGVAAVVDKGVAHLDATYYDTADERLAASSVTLRRRTGGSDAGWHLKFPVAPGVRDELHAPLSDTLPDDLAGLVRSRVRGSELLPVVRLRSDRDLRHLVDADGGLLAEVAVDAVHAERLTPGGGETQWTEIEVELADGGDPALLDKVEKRLRKAGVRPSASASKLARALAETAPAKKRPSASAGDPETAGDHVLAYVRTQRDAIVELDPAVRRDAEDSVHSMRVATRRLRSTFKSFGSVLDRAATDPVGDELKWLAGELGRDRDREVLTERLTTALDEVPATLVRGPVSERLHTWSSAEHGGARGRLLGVLDSHRYLALLDTLDALIADPPLRKAAGKKPRKVIAKAVKKDFRKVTGLLQQSRELEPGTDRDVAIHEARKKTKRTRYAAEAGGPALGKPAKTLVKSMKALQNLLGEHQDSVMARQTLRELSAVAHAAGESAFTYGLLHEREEQRAVRVEAELPGFWDGIKDGAAGL
ncbi:CHAD domain-containing protein [Streptomyces violarus]|uniref:CHAD domain-containing protein n=1 Tax=Streptomyces violarus TaxID=67380 RepID=A0A7W4ZR40_9ACTN|nr:MULTISPECIES: CYTH and CHAD domain-containing protein [Streptomyces]MBB3077095.1 CHAD domain-containing protein [Streptomyces violarus]WRU01259.1 CYTH and CHAD domain-containing protein [Streptomyces sp. CGMCC 4.1772]GHD17891.1 CHAD domain-containing protein [Streptomyces violarus]